MPIQFRILFNHFSLIHFELIVDLIVGNSKKIWPCIFVYQFLGIAAIWFFSCFILADTQTDLQLHAVVGIKVAIYVDKFQIIQAVHFCKNLVDGPIVILIGFIKKLFVPNSTNVKSKSFVVV